MRILHMHVQLGVTPPSFTTVPQLNHGHTTIVSADTGSAELKALAPDSPYALRPLSLPLLSEV